MPCVHVCYIKYRTTIFVRALYYFLVLIGILVFVLGVLYCSFRHFLCFHLFYHMLYFSVLLLGFSFWCDTCLNKIINAIGNKPQARHICFFLIFKFYVLVCMTMMQNVDSFYYLSCVVCFVLCFYVFIAPWLPATPLVGCQIIYGM